MTENEIKISKLRKEFARMAEHLRYDTNFKVSHLGSHETPEEWVAAIDRHLEKCPQCGGTGRLITGSHNGRLTGPGGHCFRCEGKGLQSWKDGRRNAFFDANQRVL